MNHKQKSNYSYEDRKHVAYLIENLKNDTDYEAIFEILICDANITYNNNSNGVYMNLTSLDDKTLDNINSYIRKINKRKVNTIEVDIDVVPNKSCAKAERTHKLSNFEQNLIKQRNKSGVEKEIEPNNLYQKRQLKQDAATQVKSQVSEISQPEKINKTSNQKSSSDKRTVVNSKSNSKTSKNSNESISIIPKTLKSSKSSAISTSKIPAKNIESKTFVKSGTSNSKIKNNISEINKSKTKTFKKSNKKEIEY